MSMTTRGLLAIVAIAACSHTPPAETAPKPDPIASFETVKAVLQSPRCVNCHPDGDRPTQGDDSHLHLQLVVRGPQGKGAPGLACTTCHGLANLPASYGPHMPPGTSEGWRLPPPEEKMTFAGRSSKALCEQLKDPKQNGGKTMAQLIDHVEHAPLVLWGWNPGYGRAHVTISHEEFVKAFRAWAAAGAPCATTVASR
jgi:hypothetical protein